MSRLLFICPDHNEPAGGIKQLYRQVDILNENGKRAYVLHGSKHFKVNWFENCTQILWHPDVCKIETGKKKSYSSKIKSLLRSVFEKKVFKSDKLEIQESDIIVLPEFYGKYLNSAFVNQKTVVYNQNCYYSFRGYGFNFKAQDKSIYQQERLLGIIVASKDAERYLNMFVKNKPIVRVKYGVDNKVFVRSHEKKKQIAFMPRKLREDSEQILNILNLRGSLKDWNVVPISGMNEIEVARVLKESAIFLSFNHREGFGMPPVEAMSCGCVVIGYSGQGGDEYLLNRNSFKVPKGNIIKFVETISEVIEKFNKELEEVNSVSQNASIFINQQYSMREEKESVLNAWEILLSNVND